MMENSITIQYCRSPHSSYEPTNLQPNNHDSWRGKQQDSRRLLRRWTSSPEKEEGSVYLWSGGKRNNRGRFVKETHNPEKRQFERGVSQMMLGSDKRGAKMKFTRSLLGCVLLVVCVDAATAQAAVSTSVSGNA